MAITIIVTNAGRAALVNAANTGTNAVTITQLGITATAFAADPAQVALPGEIKRIASVAGVVVADDAIHVTASDVTTDAYTMRGFALYLADGTLFALYGQAGAILNKTAESMMLLAADIAFADIDATMIEFGDTNFILPPATTEILGLVELATTAEGQAGSDNSRVLTPYVGKQSVLGWLLSQDGAGSGLDADLLDGLHASAFALAGHTHGTMANQNANAVAITGGTLVNVSLGLVDGNAAAPGLFWSGDTDTGLFRGGANVLAFSTGGQEQARILANGNFGLGRTDPSLRLDVRGPNADAQNAIARFTQPSADNSQSQALTIYNNPLTLQSVIQSYGAGGTAGDLVFFCGNYERGRFVYDGTFRPGANNVGDLGADAIRWRTAYLVGLDIQTSAGRFKVVNAGSASVKLSSSGTMQYDSGVASSHQFMINGVDAAVIDGSRNVGLGTTTPGMKLEVASGDQSLSRIRIRNTSADGQAWDLMAGLHNVSQSNFSLFCATSNVIAMTVTSGGAVGIGTNAPSTRLHVKSGSGQFATFESTSTRGSGNSYFGISDAAGRKAFFGYGASADNLHIMNEVAGELGFGTNGTFRWTIDQTGNFKPLVSDTYDIGSSGARVRSGYFSTSVSIAGSAAWHAGNDGSGSGLDADLLDGLHASYFLPAATFSAAEILSRLLTVDGPGSGLNADLLDGLQASDFLQIAAASVLQNGYIAFSNGLKIIWGRVSVSMDSYSNVTYPISFDSVPTPVFPTIDQIGTASQQNTLLASSTISGFSVYQAGDTSGTLPYHVIGK